jgi:hypothetical protein
VKAIKRLFSPMLRRFGLYPFAERKHLQLLGGKAHEDCRELRCDVSPRLWLAGNDSPEGCHAKAG